MKTIIIKMQHFIHDNADSFCEDWDCFIAARCPRQPVCVDLHLPDRAALVGIRRAALTIAGFAAGSTIAIIVEPGGKALIMGAAGVHGYWNQHPYCGRPGGTAIEVRGEINVVFKGDPRSLLVLPGQGGDGAPGRGGRGKAGAADDPFNRQLAHPRMDHHPDIAGYVPGGGIPNAWWRLFDGGRDVLPYGGGGHGGSGGGGGGHGGSGGGGGGTIDQIAERSIDPATYGQFGTIGGAGGGDDDLGRRGWDGKRAEYPVFHDPYFVGDQVARRRATPGGDGGRGAKGAEDGQAGASGGSGGMFLDNVGGVGFYLGWKQADWSGGLGLPSFQRCLL